MRPRRLAALTAAVAVLGGVAAAAVAVRRHYFAVTVEGHSMTPALKPGDRVLMRRRVGSPRVGDLVVVAQPDETVGWVAGAEPSGRFVKRIAAVAGQNYPAAMRRGGIVPHDHVVVLGDHPNSVDSKQYGPCPVDQVMGVAVRLPGGWGHEPG